MRATQSSNVLNFSDATVKNKNKMYKLLGGEREKERENEREVVSIFEHEQ